MFAGPSTAASAPRAVLSGLGADRGFLLAATLAALTLRAAYGLLAGPIAWPDTATYWQAGRDLLYAGRMDSDVAMPLYPLFLVIAGWRGSLWIQMVLSALEVPLVYLLALDVFGRRSVARVAALLMIVEPLSVLYASQRLTETLFTFLTCLAMVLLYRSRLRLASLTLATSVLVRPTFDPLAPFLVMLFAWPQAGANRWTKALRGLGTYVVIYALVMAPWWAHNALKYDRFVRLNLGDGIVLRIEHNPLFVQWGFWSHLGPVVNEFADEPDPVRRNEKRRAAALAFIAEDPVRYVGLAVRRLGRFWSPVLDQSENNWVPAGARWPFLFASCVIFLGALAWALQRGTVRWRAAVPLLIVIGYLTAVHAAMHAVVRYRAPLMPLVVVLAGAGWELLARRRRPRLMAQARDREGAQPPTTRPSRASSADHRPSAHSWPR